MGDEEEEEEGINWKMWIIRVSSFSVVLGVGIILAIFGSANLSACERSMLPTFIIVTGCIIIAGCGFGVLALACLSCCPNDIKQVLSGGVGTCLFLLYLVVYFVWWVAGCYWAWTVGSVLCVPRVYNVALVVTIVPIVITVGLICKCCSR